MSKDVYYIYMLRCKGGSLYTGITTDVARRLREHLSGVAPGARYTRVHTPIGLEMVWKTEGRAAASRLEYRIKHLNAREKRHLIEKPWVANEIEGLADDSFAPLRPKKRAQLWVEAS